jgi:hypothetical protein
MATSDYKIITKDEAQARHKLGGEIFYTSTATNFGYRSLEGQYWEFDRDTPSTAYYIKVETA